MSFNIQKSKLPTPVNPKPRVKHNKAVFHFQDKKAEDEVLTNGMVKSAKRSGYLNLSNKGLGNIPDKVWKLDMLVLDECRDLDFSRTDSNPWWQVEPLKTLDVSSNAISSISPNIKLLEELTTLKLHDNALTVLPSEIGELTKLTNLSLDHNKLVKFPKEFYKLVELRWLSASHNWLQKIDPAFGDLVMLNYLDLSHNSLAALPVGFGYLVRLIEINLSHNELTELPPDIVSMRELKKMYLNNNKLKSLPPLGELRKMEILDLNHNKLTNLPDFLGCACLKELYLANNDIKEITEEFCEQMQLLNVLNLRDNKIDTLPENVRQLQTLKRLDLSNNNLNKLPKNLGLLSQLNSINMEGNKLSFVRQDIIRGGTDRMMKFLRDRITDEIIAETKQTEDTWPDKFTLKKTEALVLVGRNLESVPDSVFAMAVDADVHIIDLSKNKLKSAPLGICHLSESLTQLTLNTNLLTSFPPEIGQCTNLLIIDVSKNQLSELPWELNTLKKLRELIISHNTFKTVPRCVYEMDNLEVLLAADNKIAEINVSSDALAKLTRLAVLDLTNNSITSVPPELGNFRHLRKVELMGNLFRQPRHAVLNKGTESLLCYLRDRIPTDRTPSTTSK